MLCSRLLSILTYATALVELHAVAFLKVLGRDSWCSSHPAFLGSVQIAVSHLVPKFDDTLSFPGKGCAHSFFKDLPSNLSTQNDLQTSLDVQLFAFQHLSNS